MMRKHGQTRGPNAFEKKLMAWTKERPCCNCDAPGPSIVDHMYGSTFKHNKVLIGMSALLPYCELCDQVKTNGSHNAHYEAFGFTQAEKWVDNIGDFYLDPPADVVESIIDWGR